MAKGREGGVARFSVGPYGCHGNPPQPSAEAARLRYLRGNSRGRRREVFGVVSPQRAQLPQDRGKECEGVTQEGPRVGGRERERERGRK